MKYPFRLVTEMVHGTMVPYVEEVRTGMEPRDWTPKQRQLNQGEMDELKSYILLNQGELVRKGLTKIVTDFSK